MSRTTAGPANLGRHRSPARPSQTWAKNAQTGRRDNCAIVHIGSDRRSPCWPIDHRYLYDLHRTALALGRGKLITEASVEDFLDHATTSAVLVRTPEPVRLGQLLAAPGITVINDGTNLLRVSGTTAEQIGTAAWRAHLPVYELTPTHASLEEAFMQVTKDSIEYHAGATR